MISRWGTDACGCMSDGTACCPAAVVVNIPTALTTATTASLLSAFIASPWPFCLRREEVHGLCQGWNPENNGVMGRGRRETRVIADTAVSGVPQKQGPGIWDQAGASSLKQIAPSFIASGMFLPFPAKQSMVLSGLPRTSSQSA